MTLVYPPEADIDAGRISVPTPIGTALLGLAEGQSIDWTARDGRRAAADRAWRSSAAERRPERRPRRGRPA